MAYWTRDRAARVISEDYFKISPRQLMRWSEVPMVYLNGRAHAEDKNWRDAAEARLAIMLRNQGGERAPMLKLAKLGNKAMEEKRKRAARARAQA
jgi:hypothetical protein